MTRCRKPLRHVLAAGALAAMASLADAADFRIDWDSTLYGYGDAREVHDDSPLNPGNRLAGLARHAATAEARFNLEAEQGGLRLYLRPNLIARGARDDGQPRYEGYLGQGGVRLRLSEAWSAAAGREVLNWGPAQFRSPSSPFYFDNSRGNPLRELSGVDMARLTWTPDRAHSVTLAYIAGAGHDAAGLRGSWLLTADRRGRDHAAGLALEKTPGQGLFAGLHGRYTLNDAVLLYGEAGSSTRADALRGTDDPAQPFVVRARSPRHGTFLLGAAYTFENGHTLNAESLHDGHGHDDAERAAFFAGAAADPALAGLALTHRPPLLGRDYLHLVWQSNLMDSEGYWRLMLTHSLSDGGSELAGYGEHNLDGRVTVFALGRLANGGRRGEVDALVGTSLTVGLKVALP